MGYQKGQYCQMAVGMLWMLLGAISDLALPLYTGFVIDGLNAKDYARIPYLCLELFIIITVRYFHVLNPL
jgi:ABC-type multidrug transport system fused ATPase/permease subunit